VATEFLDRNADAISAGEGVDAVLIATPDRAIDEVAARIAPTAAVVLHCSGVTGLASVAMHERHGSIHPLMALPDPQIGAERLASGGWFAVAGDPLATELVEVLGGRHFEVASDHRAAYHAAAAISANHLVALLGQVERIAAQVGVPPQAFFDMAQSSLDDVMSNGAVAALTGPAARGDVDTLDAHRAALPEEEQALYDALAAAATALAATPPAGWP